MAPRSAVELARWEVMWVVVHKGEKHIQIVECDENLAEAKRIYDLAKRGKKHMVTLRSKNVGFPPPPKYENKMKSLNARGIWWCPYCMEIRKFEKRQGFETEGGIWVQNPGFYCPMCDISHDNHHVAKYNPASMRIKYAKRTRQSKKGKNGRRRKR